MSDFDSVDSLNQHIADIRLENRKRNAQIKADRKKAPSEPPPKTIPFSTSVNLQLDEHTGNTVLILGCSKRGKSTLMMHLYDKYYDKTTISTLFSANPHLTAYGGSSNLLIGYGFNDQSAKYVQLQQYINVKTKNKYRFLNMFDDIVDSKYNMIIKKSILIYRNSNISSIICLQDVKDLEKKARGSVNHSFIFGCNTTENAREVIDLLLRPYFIDAGISDKDKMMVSFKEATSDHGFFYINNITGYISTGRLNV
jgi:hypothetical protein